jgi:microcystin-dependent protein
VVPTDQLPGASTEATTSPYGRAAPRIQLDSQTMTPVGGSQPHDNLQPYITVNFIISLFGLLPPPA